MAEKILIAMASALKPSLESLARNLMCLACNSPVEPPGEGAITCRCGASYPVIRGVPVMIHDGKGVFNQADFHEERSLFFNLTPQGRWIQRISALLPGTGGNRVSRENYASLELMLSAAGGKPRVLVLGGSIAGEGMSDFLDSSRLEILESDVSYGPRTKIILDAHEIPYLDGTFDAVVSQAVLEHVLDPHRCVAEMYRVLKPGGILYAETPFMQQVHGGPYDFTRFTHSGHRQLFRRFEELGGGMTAGPGTALFWSYQYLLLALFGYSGKLVLAVKAFSRLTGFWMKYLDRAAAGNPRAEDGASGFYFLGKRSDRVLSDRDLISYYR